LSVQQPSQKCVCRRLAQTFERHGREHFDGRHVVLKDSLKLRDRGLRLQVPERDDRGGSHHRTPIAELRDDGRGEAAGIGRRDCLDDLCTLFRSWRAQQLIEFADPFSILQPRQTDRGRQFFGCHQAIA